jgi:hypothetical protein
MVESVEIVDCDIRAFCGPGAAGIGAGAASA